MVRDSHVPRRLRERGNSHDRAGRCGAARHAVRAGRLRQEAWQKHATGDGNPEKERGDPAFQTTHVFPSPADNTFEGYRQERGFT